MSDKSRLIKKLHVYKKNKNKYRDINCIISDLYEIALDNINSFTDTENNNIDLHDQLNHKPHSISETKRKKLLNVLNDLV